MGKDSRSHERIRIEPGSQVRLADHATDDRLGWDDKEQAVAALAAAAARIGEQSARLAATRAKAVVLVLQGPDASGKDGTIRAVFDATSAFALQVVPFKAPTSTELGHDYLWRVHAALPPRGIIGVFNRSHYEDVLIVRVDELVPEKVWKRRYDHINAFEHHLADEGVVLVKCFLNVSKEAQAERLQERLEDPTKSWKFSADDLRKREQWDAYAEAYTDMLERTSTAWAPWHVVPADRNSTRNAVIAELLADTLEGLGMEWPPLDPALRDLKVT